MKLTRVPQTDNSEDEMIASRLLFLSTYDTNLNFEDLIKNHSLGDNVNYVSIPLWVGSRVSTNISSNLVAMQNNSPGPVGGHCHRWMNWP